MTGPRIERVLIGFAVAGVVVMAVSEGVRRIDAAHDAAAARCVQQAMRPDTACPGPRVLTTSEP